MKLEDLNIEYDKFASEKNWKGLKSPWIGTKNIWDLFYETNLISEELFNQIKQKREKIGQKSLP